MAPFSEDQWRRLHRVCDELGKVCNEVDSELNVHRQERDDWFRQNREWMEHWIHQKEDDLRVMRKNMPRVQRPPGERPV